MIGEPKAQVYSCYFPTRTLFVDDSSEFLEGLSLNFSSENRSYKYMKSAKSALDLLNQANQEFFWYKRYLRNLEEEELEKKLVEFNISDFYRQMFNKSRFKIITTVVVDYDMPEMDGLTFCEKITNPNIFKIMLTGAADKNVALEAYDRGLIQAFIPKQEEQVYTLLAERIKKGTDNYFANLSNVIFMGLEREKHNAFMKDNNFADFFKKLLQENDISEFYLAEGTGSYVLLNRNGEIDIFNLMPEEDVNQLYEEAQEHKVSKKELELLKNREKVVYTFGLEAQVNNKVVPLMKKFEDAKEITIGNEKYYYVYKNKIKTPSIVTFRNFLKQESNNKDYN